MLKQHQAGVPTAGLCRNHGISEATSYNWKSRYGGTSTPASARHFYTLVCRGRNVLLMA